jgi:hypothetical protein
MKTQDINIIIQKFENIESISPSENWDSVFEQKLKHSKMSKTNKTPKLNVALLFLVFLNVGFILNSFLADTTKLEVSRADNLKSIANELLISNN